ncbi:MAG: glycosyl transferase family 2 [Cyclobacteriaceae bacterium]|nr:MAG: glycosyl transferase family 2 [Cyclobacteriaceae bacterium]
MSQPTLSIIVCTYNRDKYLVKCLEHLSNQSAHNDVFEIVVVNNNSTDDTDRVCSDFKKNHHEIQFHYVTEKQQGLSICRNRGLKVSAGLLVSYIDDDAFADSDYVKNLIRYFREHPEVDAIGGKVTPVYQGDPPDWMSRYLLPLVASLDKGEQSKPFGGVQFPIGANMAFRRSVFSEAEPFHTGLGRKGKFLGSGEEKDLFYRLKRRKCQIHYVSDVKVLHYIPESRLDPAYIKKMAQGIGQSEALRVHKTSFYTVAVKWLSEFFKIGATVILGLLFLLVGKWPKAKMLIKFRIWVFGSFIKGVK